MPKHLTVNDTGEFITAAIINAPNGVAGLDATGKLRAEQVPITASGVSSVNGRVGNVSLDAAAVGAVSTGSVGAPLGVAPLDNTGKVPVSKLPGVFVQSVNGYNGPSVTLTPADIGALPSTGGTITNLGVGDTGTSFGGGKFALAIKNASILPTSNPVGGVVAYSDAGVLKVRQSNGTIVTIAATTVSKGLVFPDPTGPVTFAVYRATRAGTITGVFGYRQGGTAVTVNATKNGADLLTTNLSLSTDSTWLAGAPLQNTTVAVGDSLAVAIRSIGGTPAEVAIQIDIQEL